MSVRLSRSLFVPGRHLKKGARLPPSPLLAPTPGWPPRGGLVSAPQLPTPGWPLRERRETPPRQCVVFFCFFFFFVFVFVFVFVFFFVFFFFGGGGAVEGSAGVRSGGFLGERYLGRGWVEGEGLGVWAFSWGGVIGWGLCRGEGLGVGVFSGGEVLGSGFWVGWGV